MPTVVTATPPPAPLDMPVQPSMPDSEARPLMEAATLHVTDVTKLKRDDLADILEKYHFCRITGLVTPDDIKTAKAALAQQFSANDDHAVTGETADKVKTNFQKLSIGCARHGGVNRPRFLRTLYNPVWADDIYKLRDAFTKVAQVRNILMGMPINFAINDVEQGMWTAARLHHFPAGGGFMVSHRDTVLPAVIKEQGIGQGFYQPVMVLSKKGEDFDTGGGFAEVHGQVVEYEDYTELGDIVVYDTLTTHGVYDIDPHKVFRQDSIEGRISVLVTLYKHMA